MPEHVAIIGASDKPERYAYKAQQMLVDAGHHVYPISPRAQTILGVATLPDLAAVPVPLDTVTLYIGPAHLGSVLPALIAAHPRRVIFNPGTEAPEHEAALAAAGIQTIRACTLVLLATGQY